MEYISHEGYKNMLKGFGKQAPKQKLNEMHTVDDDGATEFHKLPADRQEGLEKEGNAFTAGLAKTKKGGEFEVGGKKFKDKTNYDASIEEEIDEEGQAKVLGRVKGSIYKIQSPTGEVSDVDFDSHLEDEIDPPYVWSGWIEGSDGEFDYSMDCDFVDEGGGSYSWEPDYSSLNASKVGEAQQDMPGFGGTLDALDKLSIREYQFDQMYPDDPGPFEGYQEPWLGASPPEDADDAFMEQVCDAVEEKLRLNGVSEEKIDKAVEYAQEFNIANKLYSFLVADREEGFDRAVDYVVDHVMDMEYGDEGGMEDIIKEFLHREGLNPAPFQATGQTIQTVKEKRNLGKLTSEQRDQLKQYVESIKTIKEEIKKMISKAGVQEGGDMTGLTMQELGPGALQSAGNPDEESDYRSTLVKRGGAKSAEELGGMISPELDSKVHRALDALRAALKAEGLDDMDIEMFLKHHIEEKGNEAIMGQHDIYENAYGTRRKK